MQGRPATWPWPLVDFLIECFNFNECEAADLSDRAQRLLTSGVDESDVANEKLWQRADKLIIEGSPMQATWDMVKQAAVIKKVWP